MNKFEVPERFRELIKTLPTLELIVLRHSLKSSEEDIIFSQLWMKNSKLEQRND